MRGVSASLMECAREGLLCVLAASLVFAGHLLCLETLFLGGQESHGHLVVTADFVPNSCSV